MRTRTRRIAIAIAATAYAGLLIVDWHFAMRQFGITWSYLTHLI